MTILLFFCLLWVTPVFSVYLLFEHLFILPSASCIILSSWFSCPILQFLSFQTGIWEWVDVQLELVYAAVQQKPGQQCKAIFLQLKLNGGYRDTVLHSPYNLM